MMPLTIMGLLLKLRNCLEILSAAILFSSKSCMCYPQILRVDYIEGNALTSYFFISRCRLRYNHHNIHLLYLLRSPDLLDVILLHTFILQPSSLGYL